MLAGRGVGIGGGLGPVLDVQVLVAAGPRTRGGHHGDHRGAVGVLDYVGEQHRIVIELKLGVGRAGAERQRAANGGAK